MFSSKAVINNWQLMLLFCWIWDQYIFIAGAGSLFSRCCAAIL